MGNHEASSIVPSRTFCGLIITPTLEMTDHLYYDNEGCNDCWDFCNMELTPSFAGDPADLVGPHRIWIEPYKSEQGPG